MSPTDAAVPAPGESELYDRRWWALAVLCLSLLIVFVGNSSLNVAIPTLSRDLHATESQLQWVVAIYSLVFAGLLFTTGALGDRFGRKGALQLGLVLFLVGAILATQSTEMWQLIGCRAVMGVGGRVDHAVDAVDHHQHLPAARATQGDRDLGEHHRRRRRVGPVASGYLLGHFWYGSVFLDQRADHRHRARRREVLRAEVARPRGERSLDPVGAVLSIVGIVALVYGLIEAPDKGWASAGDVDRVRGRRSSSSRCSSSWELHADEPMLDMHFFRNPAFSTGTGGMILVFVSMYGVMFLISQYFQLVLGYTALDGRARACCRSR